VFSSTIESKCLQVNELNIKAGKNYYRRITWLSIDTNGLNKEHLKTLYKIKGFEELPDITQINDSIIIQYKDKPSILLDLDRGQISIPQNYPIKSINNQLEKVIRVLRIDDRIENFHVTTKNRRWGLNG